MKSELIALLLISVIRTMIRKMISYAVLFHDLCRVHFSLYKSHRPAMGGESREHQISGRIPEEKENKCGRPLPPRLFIGKRNQP
jgi:hypothetical protein